MATLAFATSLLSVVMNAHACDRNAIDVVVPYPAGGSLDGVVRTVAESASRLSRKQFVVRNVAGATGTIGARQVLHAKANGCTILAGTINTLVLAPRTIPQAGYSFDDFLPVGLLGQTEYVLLANQQVDANDIQELKIAAAGRGRAYSFGHPGVETVQYMAMLRLAKELQIPVLPVPYRGSSPMLNDLGGGHIELAIVAKPVAAAALSMGTAKKLGNVSAWLDHKLGPNRLPAGWAGWVVNKHTAPEHVRWLRAVFNKAVNDPQTVVRLASIDAPVATVVEQAAFVQHYQNEMQRLLKSMEK